MKLLSYFATITLALLLLLGSASVSAQSADQVSYTPLEPIPGYSPDAGQINFAGMLNLLFKALFAAGALFAVVMLVFGGIMYMVSGAGVEMGEAKKRIEAAIWGLLLLAGAYLILYTINPQLLVFNISGIDSPTPNAAGNGPIDINIHGGNTLPVCSSHMPTASQMKNFGNYCASLGKKAAGLDETQTINGEVCGLVGCE